MSLWSLGLALAILATAQQPLGVAADSKSCALVPPKWHGSVEFEYISFQPLSTAYLVGGLNMPVHVWLDFENRRFRVDTHGGLGSDVWDYEQNYAWSRSPENNEMMCTFFDPSDLEGTAPLMILPDISSWVYAGTAKIHNAEALVWQSSSRVGNIVFNDLFYTAASNGRPLRYTSTSTGSTVYDFTSWHPGPIKEDAFNWPVECVSAQMDTDNSSHPCGARCSARAKAQRLSALLPSARVGGVNIHGELDSPSDVLAANAELVAQHNAEVMAAYQDGSAAGKPTYTMAVNRLAHLSSEGFASTHLGFTAPSSLATAATAAKAAKAATAATAAPVFTRQIPDDQLPASVDYRGAGEDGPGPKDQTGCGSCWAFSTAGLLQSAWYRATGQSLSFSEQQLINCGWNFDVLGCGGGWQYSALQYVAAAGGIAQEGDLPYLQTQGYCSSGLKKPTVDDNSTAPVPSGVNLVKGFLGPLNITARDDKALMEALVRYGPVAIAIDASKLQLYASGVFYSSSCGQAVDELDHAVLLMGYGTTKDGVDYWIIKNSWSKMWGMDGYAFMARGLDNDCGVTTWPVVALVNETVAAEARGAAKGRSLLEATTATSQLDSATVAATRRLLRKAA